MGTFPSPFGKASPKQKLVRCFVEGRNANTVTQKIVPPGTMNRKLSRDFSPLGTLYFLCTYMCLHLWRVLCGRIDFLSGPFACILLSGNSVSVTIFLHNINYQVAYSKLLSNINKQHTNHTIMNAVLYFKKTFFSCNNNYFYFYIVITN